MTRGGNTLGANRSQGSAAPGFSISIVIPTWNGLHLLRENLPSVLEAVQVYEASTGALTEIILSDDGSSDGTVDLIFEDFPSVRVVRRPSNGGFSAACNSGIEAAKYDLVALLNNDVRLDADYLLHKAVHFQDPNVFAVSAKVFEWDSTIFTTGGRFGRFRKGFWSVYFNYDVAGRDAKTWIEERRLLSTYAIGGFATYRRSQLLELGGFSELLSPFHWEDVDLSYRGWKRGWEIHYEPRSLAWHRTSATIDSNFEKNHVDSVSLRNRLLFHWVNLHYPPYLVAHIVMLALMLISKTLIGKFDFFRSVREAVQRLPQALELRRRERSLATRTDREVQKMLKAFYRAAPIQVYYNQQQVIDTHPEAREKTLGRPDHV